MLEDSRFDALMARLAAPLSRRRSVGMLGVLGLGGLAAARGAGAKKKKKHKKKSKPVACTPSCDRKICGSDGCGGDCGACSACQQCQDGACVAKANGATCGACRQCQGGQCVALADGVTCGADSCQTCQSGQCVARLDGAACPEFNLGLCGRGTCRYKPVCISNSQPILCQGGLNCCYQMEGDPCASETCDASIKSPTGHRCRIGADCLSGECLAYECV